MSARPPATRDVFELLGGLSIYGRIAFPQGERDKGKPGESRRRKATRLPHAVRVPRQSGRRTSWEGVMHVRYGQFWVLMAVVLLAACDLQPRSGTGVDNPVAQIAVDPDKRPLDPQQSFHFRVFGRPQAADSMPVPVRGA